MPISDRLRSVLDHVAVALARLAARIFYRQIELLGAERVPRSGPVLFVANHPNSLVDPILMAGFLPRLPRFLAKHTLFESPLLRPLLALGGAVPIYRRMDVGASGAARNRETFATSHQTLASGGAVALFPEGISHHEPELQQLRTGAARIALEAGAPALRIVPVGLEFEEKGRFRSRALVVVGEPLALEERAQYETDPRGAVRALTERIEAGIRAVTLNFASWREARLSARAADVLAEEERALPGLAPLAERVTLRQSLAAATRALATHQPERARALEERLAKYDALLARHELRDDQVVASYPWSDVAVHLLDRLPLLLLWVPAALAGTVLNFVPALGARLVGRFANEPQLPATYKVIAGLFGFPLWWLALGIAIGIEAGAITGAWVALAAPLTGFAALRFRETHQRLLAEVRAWLELRLWPAEVKTMRELRGWLREELRSLTQSGEEQGKAPDERRADAPRARASAPPHSPEPPPVVVPPRSAERTPDTTLH